MSEPTPEATIREALEKADWNAETQRMEAASDAFENGRIAGAQWMRELAAALVHEHADTMAGDQLVSVRVALFAMAQEIRFLPDRKDS